MTVEELIDQTLQELSVLQLQANDPPELRLVQYDLEGAKRDVQLWRREPVTP